MRRRREARLTRVVSLRLTEGVYAEADRLAEAEDLTASEWIRGAIARAVHDHQQPPQPEGLRAIGWSCEHVSVTSLPGMLGKVTAWCGCEMQPLYAAA